MKNLKLSRLHPRPERRGFSLLEDKVAELLALISADPLAYPPEFEFLKGDLKGAISRRINKQHRLVYQVLEDEKAIKVLMMWTHYE